MNKPYFYRDGFILYHDDCINALRRIESGSIDMAFVDPPYFLSNGGSTIQSGKRIKVDKGVWDRSNGVEEDFLFHFSWIKEIRRVLKDDGTIWISGTYHSIYQCGYALQLLGFHILNDITWFKPNASPNLSCRFFTASHETIIWARRSKKGKHYFDYQTMKQGDWKEDFIKKPCLQMRSVWAIYPPKKQEKIHGKHPTQKPEELLRRIILASTKVGDTILDPFSGSGTTGIVGNYLGRKYIGIDQDENYLNLTIKRLGLQG